MGKQIEDEVIPAPGMDSVKLRSPRGLFRLSGGNAPKPPKAPSRWPKAREERVLLPFAVNLRAAPRRLHGPSHSSGRPRPSTPAKCEFVYGLVFLSEPHPRLIAVRELDAGGFEGGRTAAGFLAVGTLRPFSKSLIVLSLRFA